MNEFVVELFIDNGGNEIIDCSKLNKNDMEQWKRDLEERALSEYYNQKIKISSKNF